VIVEFVLWSFAVLVIAAGAAAAVLSTRPGRHRLVLAAAVPVAFTLIFGLFDLTPEPPYHALAVLGAGGIAVIGIAGGSAVVSLVLRAASSTPTLGVHGGILIGGGDSATPPTRREVLRGGATIGHLERAALIGCVVTGQPGGVAVLVAIKGLGRFSELENELARERFLIGTLASLLWAGVCVAAILLWS
jgi:hypothetical protein